MLESLEERTEILIVTPKKKCVGGTESWKRSEGLRHSESLIKLSHMPLNYWP